MGFIKEYNPRAFYTVEDIRFVSKTPSYDPADKDLWDRALVAE